MTTIKYNDSQNELIEKILADYVNEGESEYENGITTYKVDIPAEKIEELKQNGIDCE